MRTLRTYGLEVVPISFMDCCGGERVTPVAVGEKALRFYRLVPAAFGRRAGRGAQPTQLQSAHVDLRDHRAVAARRPLRVQALRASPADERAGLHAPPRASRNRLADRTERRGLRRIQAAQPRSAHLFARPGEEFL